MDLRQRVEERWDGGGRWDGRFRLAEYQPRAPWLEDDGSRAAEFDATVQELAEELSALRMRGTALRELTESYLGLFTTLDPRVVMDVARSVGDFLDLPLSTRPSFLEDRAAFLTALQEHLACDGVEEAAVEAIKAVADDLFAHLAHATRSSYVYIPPDVKNADQVELAKMTGHLGEVIGYLVFRDLRRATCVRTKVVVDDPNGDRPGLDVLAFIFDPADSGRDAVVIVEGKGTRNDVGGMREKVVSKLRAVDARPSYYEFDRIKEELADPRHGPNPHGLPQEAVVRRVTDAWWRLQKRVQLERTTLCGLVVYSDAHHPPTPAQLEGFARVADDSRRIELLLFPLPWFDETVREVFRRAWTI